VARRHASIAGATTGGFSDEGFSRCGATSGHENCAGDTTEGSYFQVSDPRGVPRPSRVKIERGSSGSGSYFQTSWSSRLSTLDSTNID